MSNNYQTSLDLKPAPFSNLVIFGDSLSDTGNLFNVSEGLFPPSPPYFEGRFSNGNLVVDVIADSLELAENQSFLEGGSNYAFGGAQTGEGTSNFDLFGTVEEGIDIPNLGQQVDLYLSNQIPTETELFYVYGGANDFLDAIGRGQEVPSSEDIVDNITAHITELAEAGAETFVVPNLPNLGDIPLLSGQPEGSAILNAITDDFNQLLDIELDVIATELEVTIIEPDFNTITQEIIANPDEFGITNTTDAVLDLNSGTLNGDPDEFLFWDPLHPTTTAVNIIAQEAIDILPNGISEFTNDDYSDDLFLLGSDDYVLSAEGADMLLLG